MTDHWSIYAAVPKPELDNRWHPWDLWIMGLRTKAWAHVYAHELRRRWPGHLFAVRPEGSPPKPLP